MPSFRQTFSRLARADLIASTDGTASGSWESRRWLLSKSKSATAHPLIEYPKRPMADQLIPSGEDRASGLAEGGGTAFGQAPSSSAITQTATMRKSRARLSVADFLLRGFSIERRQDAKCATRSGSLRNATEVWWRARSNSRGSESESSRSRRSEASSTFGHVDGLERSDGHVVHARTHANRSIAKSRRSRCLSILASSSASSAVASS